MTFRPLWGLTAFAAPALAILIALGWWQVQRLEWKTALLADLESRIAADPAPAPSALPDAEPGDASRFVRVGGQGALSAEAVFSPSALGGRPAWREFRLFESADGAVQAIVDVGLRASDAATPPVLNHAATPVRLDALIAPAPRRGAFTPPDDPAAGIFYVRDVAAMGAALGADPDRLAPVTLAALEPIGADPATPVPPGLDTISNRHLGYVITWWGLALTLVGVYLAVHIRAGRLRFA